MNWFKKFKTFYAEKDITPEEIYIYGFKEGFNKAWEMMLPIMTQGVSNMKKHIEDTAIEETLERIYGNHKKTN